MWHSVRFQLSEAYHKFDKMQYNATNKDYKAVIAYGNLLVKRLKEEFGENSQEVVVLKCDIKKLKTQYGEA
jgi:hypothetical protein